MAKKSMIIKANRKPKYSSRKVNRCRICGKLRVLQAQVDETLAIVTLAELAGESAAAGGKMPPLDGP